MSHPVYDDDKRDYGSKYPVRTLTARVVTVISLIVSVAVLKTNDVTLENGYVFTYKDLRSYKYMFFVTVVGIGYTLLQLPFAIYCMKTKKHLINSHNYLKFDFYADKIMAFLLATGAGAAFGTTIDMKRAADESKESKFQDFFTMAYIPAAFLLVGSITCWISSVHSSLALTKN